MTWADDLETPLAEAPLRRTNVITNAPKAHNKEKSDGYRCA